MFSLQPPCRIGALPMLVVDYTETASPRPPRLHRISTLIGFPISTSFTTYCVCLELRSLPSHRHPAHSRCHQFVTR
jgi:hypothetical protein